MNKSTVEVFDKTQLVDKELVDKVSLWMLRIILNLSRLNEASNNSSHYINHIYFSISKI